MRSRGMMKTIGLLAVVVVVIGFLLYAVMQPTIGWPDEKRRVSHYVGFSVVVPLQWESHATYSSTPGTQDAIRMVPSESVGAPGYFMVARLSSTITPADLQKYGATQVTFQGKPAWVTTKDHPVTREHVRTLLFERDGKWFELTIRRPVLEPLDRGVWLKYAETFRPEKPTLPVAPIVIQSTQP